MPELDGKSERTEFEAGLRRILAYTGDKRHRRWIAYTVVFFVIYFSLARLFSWVISLLYGLAILPNSIFPNSFTFVIALQALHFIPLAITLPVFLKLRRIYKGV